MSVQPDGSVIVSVLGRKAIAAIIRSPLMVPAGLLIVSGVVPDVTPAEADALKVWAQRLPCREAISNNPITSHFRQGKAAPDIKRIEMVPVSVLFWFI
jgi:hypothetical protein